MNTNIDHEQLINNYIYKHKDDFYKLVLFLFPWGQVGTPLEGHKLEKWQRDFLKEVSADIKKNGFDGFNPVKAIRKAVASGHGIGKSALVAMLIYCIMSTRPMCRGTVTANTYTQLRTKTFAELSKWHNMAINSHWFEFSASALRLCSSDDELKDVWYCQGQTSREENSEAFAGQHTANSTSFYIFDEASAVPDKIWEVAEGGLVKGEPMFFVFGNPTRNKGAFKECFDDEFNEWDCIQIDSRSVRGSNKDQLKEWSEKHGEDSDFMRIRVRGVFPKKSSLQFISEDLVVDSLAKELKESSYKFAPVILTLDSSWSGSDPFVIGKRQGLHFEVLEEIQYNDNDVALANALARYEDEFKADAVFIDFGYGSGVYSVGKTLGRSWKLINFAESAIDKSYLNKRSEMYGLGKEWLKEGGKLEPHKGMKNELTSMDIVERMDGKLQLKSKKEMKKDGHKSPNIADAWALSFAMPVTNVKPKPIKIHNWMA